MPLQSMLQLKKINVYRITKYFLTITKTGFIILLIIEDFGITLNTKFQNGLVFKKNQKNEVIYGNYYYF